MTTKPNDTPDLNALALEACDMWQEHLSNLANNPSARAELTRFLEPQRRIFADWAAMMQGGLHGNGQDKGASASKPSEPAANPEPAAAAAASATPSGVASSGDDPLRVAQLALRLAELEKRVAELELRALSAAR